MGKGNNTDESDLSENEIPDLNSLEPSEFEPETNIGDINTSCSDDEEEGAEYKLKRISNIEWCECSAKSSGWQMFFKVGVRPATLLKRLQPRCFPMKFMKFLKTPFLHNTSTLVAASGTKQCKPVKTYTERLCCRERNDVPERYF